MKLMKKLTCLLLCLIMVAALVPMTAPEADAATKKLGSIAIEVPVPELGKKLAAADEVWTTSSKYVEVESLNWYGDVGDGNTAITDEAYGFQLNLKIKDGQDAVFNMDDYKDIELNGGYIANGNHAFISSDKKILTIYHRFPFVLTDSGKQSALTGYSGAAVTIDTPVAGEKPATAEEVGLKSSKTEVTKVTWSGKLDENGCFKAGVKYSVTIQVRIKDSVAGMYYTVPTSSTVNGKEATGQSALANDYRTINVKYTFPATKDVENIAVNGNVRVNITEPKVGEWPTFNPTVSEEWDAYVSYVEWDGEFDEYGRFKAGETYTLNLTLRADPSTTYKFKANTTNLINNDIATLKSVSKDYKEIKLSHTYVLSGSAAAAPQGTSVEKFQPGDYGTMRLVGGDALFYDTPDSSKEQTYYERGDVTVVVLEANVPGVGPNRGTWHIVLYKGKMMYVRAASIEGMYEWDDLVVYGNNPVGTYRAWDTDEDYTTGMISGIETDAVVVGKDGVPKMDWLNSTDPNGSYRYYADTSSIVYSTNKAEPYTFVTATVTYKARSGNFFYEGIKTDISGFGGNIPSITLSRGNSAEIQYVDRNTIKVTYTVFVEDIYDQDTYTDEMKSYVESRVNRDGIGFITSYFNIGGGQKQYVATAELYNPLGQWFEDMDFPIEIVNLYQDKYKIRRYAAPTDDGHVSLSSMTWGYQQTYEVEVYDLDASDMFPGQTVGEWVQIGGGDFYPKAYLRSVDVTDNNVSGTPGHHVDPVFSFAGGSGTKEDPYLIATAEQLNAIRLSYNETYYKLIADIDLSKWGNWVPIGGNRAYGGWPSNSGEAHYNTFCFSGVLDGNGHTISGMTIKIDADSALLHTGDSEAFFGLFAATAGYNEIVGADGDKLLRDYYGVIKNLTLKDFTIDVTYRDIPANFRIYAGGIAGLTTSSRIINCKTVGGKINVQIKKDTANDGYTALYAAGLVGLSRDASFENCSSSTAVSVRRNVGEDEFLEFQTNALVNKTVGSDSTTIKNSKGTGKVTVTDGEPVAAKSKFTDVPTTQYYFKPVEWAVSQAITTGTTATTFSPDNTCTRAQILTFLWRAVGAPKVGIANPFTDVKTSDYFYYAALWAYDEGMVSGTKFAGDTLCTREATVVYLWKYVGSPAVEATNKFTDVPANAAYAQAVAWAVSKGVTTGTSATTFSPTNTCTRGQIATFLYRALGTPVNTK